MVISSKKNLRLTSISRKMEEMAFSFFFPLNTAKIPARCIQDNCQDTLKSGDKEDWAGTSGPRE